MTLCFTVPQRCFPPGGCELHQPVRRRFDTSRRTASSASRTPSSPSPTTTSVIEVEVIAARSAPRTTSSRRRSSRRHRHRSVRRAEEPREAPAHRPRARVVPRRLGEGQETHERTSSQAWPPRRRGTREAPPQPPSREPTRAEDRHELKAIGAELGLDLKAVRKKDELIDAVLEAKVKAEGFVEVVGILRCAAGGLRLPADQRYLPATTTSTSDVEHQAPRVASRDMIRGQVRPPGVREVRGAAEAGLDQRQGPRRTRSKDSVTSRRSTPTRVQDGVEPRR